MTSGNSKTIILNEFEGDKYFIPEYVQDDWKAKNSENIRSAVALDIETTGFLYEYDQIIEIAIIPFRYNSSDGMLVDIGDPYSSLNDLEEGAEPLPENISHLTGLYEQDLCGHKIDWGQVDKLLSESDIIIAHNASFDRSFIDKLSTVSPGKIWGCSMEQIDWIKKGYRTKKLELLCHRHNFFVKSHRALADAQALLYLITSVDKSTENAYLFELLNNAKTPKVRVEAHKAAFELKDLLKRRQYKWSPYKRVWSKLINQSELESEKEWLASRIYNNSEENPSCSIQLSLQDAFKVD